jgi:hypothetical protein
MAMICLPVLHALALGYGAAILFGGRTEMDRRIVAFVVLLLMLAAAPSAHAERRVALLIGNGIYSKVGKLENPTRDAAAMETLLRKAGFDAVDVKRDLGRDAMRRALRDFSETVREADIALVFYAGHGIEVKLGFPCREDVVGAMGRSPGA